MNPRSLTIVEDLSAFAEAVAELFVISARHAIAARGRFIIALTGGSAPAPVYRLLAQEPFRSDVDWSKVVVLYGDDRAVPPTSKESNHHAAHEDLLRHVGAEVHRMEGENPDLEAAAASYEALLEKLGPIDFMFVGLGKDAHVLSLYPGSPHIDEHARRVVASIDPPMDPKLSRITMTPRVVAEARRVVCIVTGAAKREAVRRALNDPDDPKHTPVHVLRTARDLRFIVDREAYGD